VSGGAFGGRSAVVLAAVAGVSLAATAFLGIYGDVLSEPQTFAADSWSRSAIGHRAFLELLRREGREVLVSRYRTADKAAGDAVVLLLEPEVGERDDDGEGELRHGLLTEVDEAAHRLLVVLPKRRGFPDPLRPSWLRDEAIVPLAEPQALLDALEIDGAVTRPDQPVEWKGDLPTPTLASPQLVRSDELEPLLETAQGMLVGRRSGEGWETIVVSDPDVLATHGLGLGENAALALAVVDLLGGEARPIVVDETLHGHAVRPSLARELLRFPLVLATLHAVLAGLLLAWTALVRFGRPRAPEPALRAGKATLVEHTAELLRAGGHLGHAAQAYLRAAKDDVVARLRPPGESTEPDLWLHQHAAARGKARALRLAEERVSRLDADSRGADAEVVRAAVAIHRWREEMTDGAVPDPRPDR
jgi:hypothetical protein